MRLQYSLLGGALLAILACSSESDPGATIGGPGVAGAGSNGAAGAGNGGFSTGASGGYIDFGDWGPGCAPTTCRALGWACGYTVDACDNVINCADEGLGCAADQVCTGGIDGPTQCVASVDAACEVCAAVPDCSGAAEPTRLAGRVITPGRDDGNTQNQVGVPNAVVYILRNNDVNDLPAISTGVPSDGQSCDRCEDQDLGPLLTGAITDAAGDFVLEGNIPLGVEFMLVVKVGKFRRAVLHEALPTAAACQTTTLPSSMPNNPTRLARTMSDGLAVNMPLIAISTGRIDAMECVFEKMGIAAGEFGNFGANSRVHLYRGSGPTAPEGAVIDVATPGDVDLYGSLPRLQSYDLIVADCEGGGWDGKATTLFSERIASGANVREYVNRGGRLFASHLSFSWLHENGSAAHSDVDPIATGLAPAGSWDVAYQAAGNLSTAGTGVVSIVGARPNLVSPRIQGFADWLVNEGVTTAPAYQFAMTDPRSMAISLGSASEEFVYRSDSPPSGSAGDGRVQQFAFDTPYAAPPAAACGRVAYSGFHVAGTAGGSDPFNDSVFPGHCTDALANNGNLTNQEKVLLYMLFDLGSCVGEEPLPPPCVPVTCASAGARCGFAPDGCGNVIDCGACRPPA